MLAKWRIAILVARLIADFQKWRASQIFKSRICHCGQCLEELSTYQSASIDAGIAKQQDQRTFLWSIVRANNTCDLEALPIFFEVLYLVRGKGNRVDEFYWLRYPNGRYRESKPRRILHPNYTRRPASVLVSHHQTDSLIYTLQNQIIGPSLYQDC